MHAFLLDLSLGAAQNKAVFTFQGTPNLCRSMLEWIYIIGALQLTITK